MWNNARRFGKNQEKFHVLKKELSEGKTILVMVRKELTAKSIVKTLKEMFDIDVEIKPSYTTPPMKLVFDVNDPSPEPGFTFEFGEKKITGYIFKLKS